MDKFQRAIEGLIKEFPKVKEILIVYIYGSVARKDYSLRHSDLDLFIVLTKTKVSSKIKEKIDRIIIPIGAKFGVNMHIEYQGLRIRKEDQTLVQKMIEEGRIIYSCGVWPVLGKQLGLKAFILYEYSTKNVEQKTRTRLTQILHGRNVNRKEYKGLVDNEKIFSLGKGALLVSYDKRKDIEQLFERLKVQLRVIRIIFC